MWCGDCFGKSLWMDLQLIKNELVWLLCCYGEKHVMFLSGCCSVQMNWASRHYIESWLARRNIGSQKISVSFLQPMIRQQLQFWTCQRNTSSNLLRFDSNSMLDVLCKMLGENAIFGVRWRLPRFRDMMYNVRDASTVDWQVDSNQRKRTTRA